MDISEALSEFISQELLDTDTPVAADENLLSDGMVDSLGMVRLVGFIEDRFGFSVPPEDFTLENFRTIGVLTSYLQRALESTGEYPA